MKTWQKGTGHHFRNSDVCDGEVFAVGDSPVDMATVRITGRYPGRGFLYNEESYEMVYVVSGNGSIETAHGSIILNVGDVVQFVPNERVAWDGDMTILIVCSPQFDASKHKIEG